MSVVGVGTLEQLRESVSRAHSCITDNPEVALWILAGLHDRLADLIDAVDLYAIERAMMVALDLETCRRILLGLPVHPDRLDPEQVHAFAHYEGGR